jgi:uncharacterized protein YndB with AHSA1/START domain
MTSTEQRSALRADYQTTIRLKASPDALFDALTTVTGLAGWWNPATGSGETGGELRFIMNAPEPLVIHVDEATRPSLVRWTVTDCPFLPDWIGTKPTFTITPADGGTSELHFHHHGLSDDLECIDIGAWQIPRATSSGFDERRAPLTTARFSWSPSSRYSLPKNGRRLCPV